MLSHDRASDIEHESIALSQVQSRRSAVSIPCADGPRRGLHSYVNLYFCARNPMMYLRKDEASDICVVGVDSAVMQVAGVVIADMNAARTLVRFGAYPEGLAMLDTELVYARYWTHEDEIEYDRRKAIKCAEVLVPEVVPASYITRVIVVDDRTMVRVKQESGEDGPGVEVSPDVFFR